jgi:hypothetical protein
VSKIGKYTYLFIVKKASNIEDIDEKIKEGKNTWLEI